MSPIKPYGHFRESKTSSSESKGKYSKPPILSNMNDILIIVVHQSNWHLSL